MEKPLVSIAVTVYNHKRYIERCILGIAMQKCDFPFDVWIGEDCSPDGSREVLKRLEAELPDNFHFLYREHNMGDAGDGNSSDLLARCTGKYFAMCEGDDFWTYDHKLQEQVDYLESHPDHVACFHHCEIVGEDSEPNGEKYPDCLEEEYSFKEYFYCTMPGQLGTMMVRLDDYNEQKRRFIACRAYENYASDRRNAFMLLVGGKIHVIQEKWSAYRHVIKGGASYSAKTQINERYAKNEIDFFSTVVDYAQKSGNPEAIECAKACYYRVLLKWSVGSVKVARLGDSFKAVMTEKRWPAYLWGVPRWYAVLGTRALRGRGVSL